MSGTGPGSASGVRHSIPMGALTLNRPIGMLPANVAAGQAGNQVPKRGVQFRQPVVQFSGVSSTLFEDDPGIMSEVETVSTSGRRRQQQQQQKMAEKHLLPVVRTPSKTLERPLGLVFLIYRGETKRALLPNEITSLDTVKALFVRSFGKLLTMEYMDTPRVKIYIHDSNKDIFYELENLTEIKDRTVLKLFEADSSGRGPCGLGPSGMPPITNSDELTPLPTATVTTGAVVAVAAAPQPVAEPEYVDSWHVKAMKALNRAQKESDLVGVATTRGMSSTLPRPLTSNEASSRSGLLGERSKTLGPGFLRGHRFINGAALPGQQGMGGRVESGYVSSPDGNFEFETSLGRVLPISGRFSSGMSEPKYYRGPESTEEAKERMMHMESQLSQLTGMVEKALKNKKFGKKTVSFDKAVTYSDDSPPQPTSILTNSAKRQQQQVVVVVQQPIQPPLPVPHPNPHSHHHHQQHNHIYHAAEEPNLMMDPGLYNQLRGLQRSARDLRQEVKVLKRLTQLQSMAMKDLVQDTYLKLREACIAFAMSQTGALTGNAFDLELWRVAQDEEIYQKELNELVRSISHLEAKVEETRSGVINKKNKIHLADVENMALILSKSSRTVTQLKRAFPTLEANLRSSASFQQQQLLQKGDKSASSTTNTSILVTEDFLKRTPERLDNIWKRCKKLTGTLVTLKRLASVQEQRIHPGSNVDVHHGSLSPTPLEMNRIPPSELKSNFDHVSSKESTLDDLLDALQNYSGGSNPQQPHHYHHHHQTAVVPKQHSEVLEAPAAASASPLKWQPPVPTTATTIMATTNLITSANETLSGETTTDGPIGSKTLVYEEKEKDNIQPTKMQIPTPADRKSTAIAKGAPPPPPPRTSSNKSIHPDPSDHHSLSRTTSTDVSSLNNAEVDSDAQSLRKTNSVTGPPVPQKPSDINSLTAKSRQDLLEVRHQELLQRQKQLQEQYQRLQEMQQKKSAATIVANSTVASTIHNNTQHQLQQQLILTEKQALECALAKKMESENQLKQQSEIAEEVLIIENSGSIKDEANEETKNCLGEDFPFADSSLKDGDTSSDSTSNEPSSSTNQKDEEEEVEDKVPKLEPAVQEVSVVVVPVKNGNGKVPPEVPARKSKENNVNTKVYHSEII